MGGPITTSALYEQVADRLRRRIYRHELRPGQAIDEKALCAHYGISRTPLREALKVLHAEGLVELIPRRGCVVKSLDIEELNELFPVMAVLEGLAAREAVRRCGPADLKQLEAIHERLEAHAARHDIDDYYEDNREFHQAVQDLSRNRWLQRVATDLRRILRLARHEQLTLPGRLQDSLEEHRRIMDAFRRGDEALADRCMQEHLIQQGVALDRLMAGENKTAAS
jgi:DNA-binding GntR family transcriptional regulator